MKTVPLRHLADLNPSTPAFDHVAADEQVTFLPLEAVWSDSRADHGRLATKSDVASGYTRFRAGDVVCPKVTPTFQAGRSMVVQSVGAGTTELHILRPREGVDARWLCYAVRSKHFLDEGVTAFQGVAGLQRVPPEFVNSFRVAEYSPKEQRRIADFLDDRISRIDRIIAARRKQLKFVKQLPWIQFDASLTETPKVPLRRAIAFLADGPFGSAFSSADYVDTGAAVIRLGNIGFAEFRGEDLARVSDAIYAKFPLTHVMAGDLLIASLGDATNHAGRACLAPPTLGTAMVKGKCFRATTQRDVASEKFLAVLLSSPLGAKALVQQGTGATRSMLNFERLLSCRLPIPARNEQERFLDEFRSNGASVSRASSALGSSIDLLSEYKSSLITAAVTGELDVSTAGSSIPG